jgi:hypothetical protein
MDKAIMQKTVPFFMASPNYDDATASSVLRWNFCRPFVLSPSLSTSTWLNLNPPVRISQA